MSNLDWEALAAASQTATGRVRLRPRAAGDRAESTPPAKPPRSSPTRAALPRTAIMFRRLWSAPIAALILAIYRASYLANRT